MTAINPSQLCGMNFHYFRHPLTRFLDDAAAIGLTKVEIWGASPHFYVDDEPLSAARELKKAIRERGMELVCFTPEQCIYPINLASREDAVRNRSIRYFLDSLNACVEMESPYLLITPGWGYADEDAGPAWRRSADALGVVARHAEKLGVDLLLEPLTPTESNIINTSADLRRMLDELSSPSVKAILDTVAMAVVGETVRDYVAQVGAELRHVHLIDGDMEGSHLAWGDGFLPLDDYIRDLGDSGYTGALSFEFTTPRYWLDPLPPMRKSFEVVQKVIHTV
ncbi:hypothetical protein DC522_30400 [Microvirga sp. KLBC 81]|uniref:TIM barrel protein n=1 Tax=Microvirga sp. KLBC 81 TaxID=1862707 RepID=UPI000D5141D9|nr:TIM barrel protein [Microvirga sp. KLBC 81]PVE20768.1 hypothetical protein DC522_30400 [Microvirga sp. KLBC 81]